MNKIIFALVVAVSSLGTATVQASAPPDSTVPETTVEVGAPPVPETTLPSPVRGEQNMIDPPEGKCYTPYHQMNDYPGLNYIPCDEVTPAPIVTEPLDTGFVEQPDPATVTPPSCCITTLPATGTSSTLAGVAALVLFIGIVLYAYARYSDKSLKKRSSKE